MLQFTAQIQLTLTSASVSFLKKTMKSIEPKKSWTRLCIEMLTRMQLPHPARDTFGGPILAGHQTKTVSFIQPKATCADKRC